MKTFALLVMSAICIAAGYVLIKSNAQTQPSNCPTGCCCPPNGNAPRFAKGSTVTVYIDSSSGFTPTEIQMIREGIEDWNDEVNN